MPAGFQSIADNGSVQIDENFFCLAAVVKGVASANILHPAGAGTGVQYCDISYTGDTPLLAFYIPPPQAGCILSTVKNGNTWTWRVLVLAGTGQAFNPNFTYYIFDRPVASASGAGIEVYDAQGRLTFSSLAPLVNIASFYDGGNPGNAVIDTNKIYAVCYNGGITVQQFDETLEDGTQRTDWLFTAHVAGSIGGGVTSRSQNINGGRIEGGGGAGVMLPAYPGSGLEGWGNQSGLLAIDVTALGI